LFLAACAYYILQLLIIRSQGKDSILARAVGGDIKGKLSPILYITGIATAYISPPVAEFIYILVALIWLVPDKRIERMLLPDRS
jgi:hypothetical protein